jgi:phosphatidylinositol glycan class T
MERLECDASKSYHSGDTCYPFEKTSEPAWNLAEIFGRPIRGDCPITGQDAPESTTVCINVPSEREILPHTEPRTPIRVEKFDDGSLTCFKPPPNGTEFSIILPEQNMTARTALPVPRIHAFRAITGYGQERGGIQTILSNPSPTESLDVIYLESLPWYMKPYLHTLRSSLSPPSDIQTIKETYYRPALDRHRGTHLELGLTIPPASSLSLTYDFEKAILRYTEYPPDANRGFDVPAAVIRILPGPPSPGDSAGARRRGIYARTTTLLLPLPTPDFSMPYNVIILTSTVMALGFGSIYNILVRRFVAPDEVPPARMRVVLGALALRVGGRLRGIMARLKGGREKTE